MALLTAVVAWLGVGVAALALGYSAVAMAVLLRWERRRRTAPRGETPPVTVLKPLCGAEPELYHNLRSFCDQDYPRFEVIFGVRSLEDPAVAVVERLKREFPWRRLELVVDEKLVGVNFKISNLVNMMPRARYDHLVVADSDIRVGPDYLAHVVNELADPETGVVTCLYRGRPLPSLSSHLGALFIDAWFLPSVLVGRALGYGSFCFGATMALHRSVLERIGGFESLAWHLADDYVLGERVRAEGFKVTLSGYVVQTTVHEPGLRSLWHHELRWVRTIRTVQPVGHAFSFISFAIPVSLFGAMAAWGNPWALAFPAAAFVLRTGMFLVVNRDRLVQALPDIALVPVRAFMSFFVWALSFGSRRVRWRRQQLWVGPDGRMRQHGETAIAKQVVVPRQRETEFRS
ncbi:MAG TPA: bacteriohopanetetrol glucosamine biosynthesis glycosyltransferase HpnI [Gammaproteobacteria bacterium]|nr:bacteriohopanetetrol glucosamine biosynthesis glycosyltransferase HpnI [Gammaproteobacteria bacterium]